jgi:hypothetical protein
MSDLFFFSFSNTKSRLRTKKNSCPHWCLFFSSFFIFLFQKLDFVKLRSWRERRAKCLRTRKAKKANLIETFKTDSKRLNDGSLRLQTNFPPKVTSDGLGISCCSTAFCKLYGLSSKTKSAYWKLVCEGSLLEENEAKELRTCVNEGRKQQTLLWMKDTFHILCDILPTSDYSSKNYHLPKCMTKNSLHKEYWVEFSEKQSVNDDPVVQRDFNPYSRPTFAKLWLDVFPYVQIPEHTAFSVCSHCANLHDRLITATKSRDKVMQREIQVLRKLHLRFISGERLTYRDHQNLARDYPASYVCLTVDGMDQAKLRGPHFAGGAIPKGTFIYQNSFIVSNSIFCSTLFFYILFAYRICCNQIRF